MKSLFTNVHLGKTKDFILKKGVQRKENPNIPKTALKELLYLCSKQLHFNFQ